MHIQNPLFMLFEERFAVLKVPPRSKAFWLFAGPWFNLIAGPEDGAFCRRIESFRLKKCAVIMISLKKHVEIHDFSKTLARIRTVTNNVTKAKEFVRTLTTCVCENRCQSFEIAVYVANNGSQLQKTSRRAESS
jgi:hypothetical protein